MKRTGHERRRERARQKEAEGTSLWGTPESIPADLRDARMDAVTVKAVDSHAHENLDDGPSEAPKLSPGRADAVSQRTVVRKAHSLIDQVYNWENLYRAWRRVRANKGAHGLDKVSIHAYEQDVEKHLLELQRKLMEDRYEPTPVRRVYIPKGNDPKQKRPIGIPTVTDRVCQQAVLQVLSPIFDPTFSDRSFGFRPARKAHHAIATAIRDGKEGYTHVLDADISSFFDRLDHEVAMSLVNAKIADRRVSGLLKAFIKAGVSENDVVSVPTEGSPQGGVISPLISNIVLDVLDKALESRGWRFVRYADDFIILTKTAEEANESLAAAKEVLGKLNLSLHETKTRLASFSEGFEFLGFRFRYRRIGIRDKSMQKFKDRVRHVTRRAQGRNVQAVIRELNAVIRGWAQYFGVGEVANVFWRLDCWIRTRIRAFRLKRKSRLSHCKLTCARLAKWGLLSLQQCRPAQRLSYVSAYGSRERAGLLATRKPHGVAQCSNTAC